MGGCTRDPRGSPGGPLPFPPMSPTRKGRPGPSSARSSAEGAGGARVALGLFLGKPEPASHPPKHTKAAANSSPALGGQGGLPCPSSLHPTLKPRQHCRAKHQLRRGHESREKLNKSTSLLLLRIVGPPKRFGELAFPPPLYNNWWPKGHLAQGLPAAVPPGIGAAPVCQG